ncbi:hypothetical protein EVAR_44803_1 [Eumeta japonica]|uniref:Uncharacterized protein n=1 Tax=Eumeta variegata TaxID=151549 RepID=A0A4C1XBA8_EUMVA|nr:hypothetical protein EVAR_44803_1 [Eumeta japonica]
MRTIKASSSRQNHEKRLIRNAHQSTNRLLHGKIFFWFVTDAVCEMTLRRRPADGNPIDSNKHFDKLDNRGDKTNWTFMLITTEWRNIDRCKNAGCLYIVELISK